MNDRFDTTTTSDADERIDALARSAGNALRRPAAAGQLALAGREELAHDRQPHRIAEALQHAVERPRLDGGGRRIFSRGRHR